MLDSMLDSVIDIALAEDLSSGDLTTEACVAEDAEATAHAVARNEVVVCGGRVFERVLHRVKPDLDVRLHAKDGARAKAGERIWSVVGSARAILMAERTALNLVQRMCGIATLTRSYVDARPEGSTTRIADTRKTTPGLRALERYSVRVGGGHNHRDNLGSAVLIKDNHIVASGGVREAIFRARARAPHTSRIECEVDSLEQLDVALDAGADVVLLDNMTTAKVAEAVGRARGRALIEASGGITKARVKELAAAGVDVISCGALTHSAPAADIGLDFE
jgi:nicotinate-nucleotide pyrophosphorylase (carboxylating)